MKRILHSMIFVITIGIIFLNTSCNKDETRICVSNVDPITSLEDVSIGPAHFGYIDNGNVTSYKAITEGQHEVVWKAVGMHHGGTITISSEGSYILKLHSLGFNLVKK